MQFYLTISLLQEVSWVYISLNCVIVSVRSRILILTSINLSYYSGPFPIPLGFLFGYDVGVIAVSSHCSRSSACAKFWNRGA